MGTLIQIKVFHPTTEKYMPYSNHFMYHVKGQQMHFLRFKPTL